MKLIPKRKLRDGIGLLDGGSIQSASIIAQSIKDLTITNAKIVTLDATKITTGYLSADRIDAGTITATQLSFSAFDTATNTLDDIENGGAEGYSKVLTTDISSGHITLESTVKTSSYRTVSDSEKGTWNGKVLTFSQTTAPTAEATGDLWIDTDDGNKLYRWSGSAWVEVPPELANAAKTGEWYDASGVEIDATHGINIYGTANALTTRATKTGTIQCYVGADGKIYAGAGTVILDATVGVTIKGQKLKLQTTAAGSDAYVYVSAGGDLVLVPAYGKWTYVYQEGLYSNSLRLPAGGYFGVDNATPVGFYFNTATTWKGTTGCDHAFLPSKAAVAGVGWGYIGNATNFWYKIYSQYYYYKTAPASFQEHDDIAMLKGMKSKKHITKEGKEVSLIDMATIPAEVKVREKRDDTEPGQPAQYEEFIDNSALTGLIIGTLKKLIDKVEVLAGRS